MKYGVLYFKGSRAKVKLFKRKTNAKAFKKSQGRGAKLRKFS